MDLNKIFVHGDSVSLGKRNAAGKEFHSIGAEYLKDRFRVVLMDVTAGR